MEGLPWPAITAATGGWLLAFVVLWTWFRKMASGDLVTRREVDGKTDEAVHLRGSNDRLLEINGEQTASIAKFADAFDAFRVAAEEKKP